MLHDLHMIITSKGGSRRREKNLNVQLMMMWAFVPSAVTASDATTTSGLGSGFSSGSQSKSSRSLLQLILRYFLPISCSHTKSDKKHRS